MFKFQIRQFSKLLPLFLSFIFIFLQSCGSPEQSYDRAHFQQYPPLSEVIKVYYTANTAYFQYPPSIIRFEKRKTGWFMARYDGLDFSKAVENVMVWSAKDAKFKMLGGALDERGQKILRARQQVAEEQYYNICPLFGYAEAANDLIQLLEKTKDLHPQELECLARAYSRLSAGIIAPNQFGAAFQPYDSLFNANAYSTTEINRAIELSEKAMAIYAQLESIAPDYPTPAGSAAMKQWNEALSTAFALRMVQHPQEGEKLLKKELYNSVIIANAKNFLSSCGQGAILFTWGDNDSYPLLYVQDKFQFRTDVTIINLSLANMGRYIYYLGSLLPEEKRISTTLDINAYKLDESESFAVQNNPGPLDFKQYLETYKANSKQYQENKNGVKYSILPAYRLLVKASPDSVIFAMQSPYTIKSEFYMFDVIASNIDKRPIHFSPSIPSSATAFFSEHLIVSGLSNRFIAKKAGKLAVDLPFSKALITQKMEYVLPAVADRYKIEYKSISAQMGMLFFQVATAMQKAGQQDSIAPFLQFMHQKMPFDQFQYDQYHLYFHQLCMLIKAPELAKKHLRAYGNELGQTVQRLEADPRLHPDEKAQIIQSLKIQIQTLVSTAKADKLDDVSLELENKFTKYLL